VISSESLDLSFRSDIKEILNFLIKRKLKEDNLTSKKIITDYLFHEFILLNSSSLSNEVLIIIFCQKYNSSVNDCRPPINPINRKFCIKKSKKSNKNLKINKILSNDSLEMLRLNQLKNLEKSGFINNECFRTYLRFHIQYISAKHEMLTFLNSNMLQNKDETQEKVEGDGYETSFIGKRSWDSI
jgi:hypothetical protein